MREALLASDRLAEFALRHKSLEAVSREASALIPDSEIGTQLMALARQSTMRTMNQVAKTVELYRLLDDAGCQPLLLKGVALSMQTTGRIEARGSGDIDILVPPEKLSLAVRLIEGLGAERLSSDVMTFRMHATTFSWRGTGIDLHHRMNRSTHLCDEPHAEKWERGQTLVLAGANVRTLSPVDAAAYMALSSGMDTWSQFIRLADQARLMAIVRDAGADEDLQRTARRWHVSSLLRLALAMLRRANRAIPRQDRVSEDLALRSWIRLAHNRQLRLEADWRARYGRQLYQLAAVPDLRQLTWWSARNLTRFQE